MQGRTASWSFAASCITWRKLIRRHVPRFAWNPCEYFIHASTQGHIRRSGPVVIALILARTILMIRGGKTIDAEVFVPVHGLQRPGIFRLVLHTKVSEHIDRGEYVKRLRNRICFVPWNRSTLRPTDLRGIRPQCHVRASDAHRNRLTHESAIKRQGSRVTDRILLRQGNPVDCGADLVSWGVIEIAIRVDAAPVLFRGRVHCGDLLWGCIRVHRCKRQVIHEGDVPDSRHGAFAASGSRHQQSVARTFTYLLIVPRTRLRGRAIAVTGIFRKCHTVFGYIPHEACRRRDLGEFCLRHRHRRYPIRADLRRYGCEFLPLVDQVGYPCRHAHTISCIFS